ncbi:MAG: transposase [Halofilum sp. (in: g-proteobacteria)]
MSDDSPTRMVTYTARLYPTAAQRAILVRWFGAARWIWNHALERRSKACRRRGERVSGSDVSRAITALKQTTRYGWLGEVPSTVLVQKLRDRDWAFRNFFEGRARYPRFRRRANGQAVRLQLDQRQVRRRQRWEAGAIAVPGLGELRFRAGRHPQAFPKMTTIRQAADGSYHASFTVEREITPRAAPVRDAVGVGVGLKDRAVLSSGDAVTNPRHVRRAEPRRRRAQRALSRKQNGSNRWHAQRRRLARANARVCNRRNDHLHKLTRLIVDENQVIAVEDLGVRALARTSLASSVHDAAWGELLRQLRYKADWAGRTFVAVDRYAPTTQVCSGCGAQTGPSGRDGLNVRQWRCDACGAHHDRDENAAINIRELGMAQLLPAGSGEVRRVEAGGCSRGDAAAVPAGEARARQADSARTDRADEV